MADIEKSRPEQGMSPKRDVQQPIGGHSPVEPGEIPLIGSGGSGVEQHPSGGTPVLRPRYGVRNEGPGTPRAGDSSFSRIPTPGDIREAAAEVRRLYGKHPTDEQMSEVMGRVHVRRRVVHIQTSPDESQEVPAPLEQSTKGPSILDIGEVNTSMQRRGFVALPPETTVTLFQVSDEEGAAYNSLADVVLTVPQEVSLERVFPGEEFIDAAIFRLDSPESRTAMRRMELARRRVELFREQASQGREIISGDLIDVGDEVLQWTGKALTEHSALTDRFLQGQATGLSSSGIDISTINRVLLMTYVTKPEAEPPRRRWRDIIRP